MVKLYNFNPKELGYVLNREFWFMLGKHYYTHFHLCDDVKMVQWATRRHGLQYRLRQVNIQHDFHFNCAFNFFYICNYMCRITGFSNLSLVSSLE